MTWLGDACSLVDAFRAKELSPLEALEACERAIDASELNAVVYQDVDAARSTASKADVTLPFGGVPVAIKELDPVKGWPENQASLALADVIATEDSTMVTRLKAAGIVPVGQSAASEFGGMNYTSTKIHGTTRNPWNPERTPGGSSGGTAAGVAGGLFPLGTAGDGGGSIRIPAGFTGMFGLKATFGRIPNGPATQVEPLTTVFGCISRSIRDTARWFDVCNGQSEYDPFSLPRVHGWERDLGSFLDTLRGKSVLIAPSLGGSAFITSAVTKGVRDAAALLVADAQLKVVDLDIEIPRGGMEWAMAGMGPLLAGLGDRYPECEPLLTSEIMFMANIASRHYSVDVAKGMELYRQRLIRTLAEIFESVDFVIAATNPDVAFAAAGPLPTTIDGVDLVAEHGFDTAVGNNGALTIPANTAGNPAVAIPIGLDDGLPISMQIIGRHHAEQLLMDLALVVERERPWPLVAPTAPR